MGGGVCLVSVLCLSSVCVLIVMYRLYYQLRKVSGGGGWVGGWFYDYSFSFGPFQSSLETSLRE